MWINFVHDFVFGDNNFDVIFHWVVIFNSEGVLLQGQHSIFLAKSNLPPSLPPTAIPTNSTCFRVLCPNLCTPASFIPKVVHIGYLSIPSISLAVPAHHFKP